MAHMNRISMGDMYGVHGIRFQARARAPDLVLPPREMELWNPMFISASAPCQGYSTADVQNLSEAPRLISLMRDHLRATGRLIALENVKGAARESGTERSASVWFILWARS